MVTREQELTRFINVEDSLQSQSQSGLPESVKKMVGEVYAMLTKGGESQESLQHLPQKAANSSEELAVSI
jgi:hypothetical protein